MAAERLIQIAGISTVLKNFPDSWPLESFAAFEGESSAPVDHWTIDYKTGPLPSHGALIFDSGESWAGFSGDGYIDLVQYTRDPSGKRVEQGVLRVFGSTRSGVLYDSKSLGLSYPFDELFFMNAFSLTNRVLVHSCAVEHNGEGILFCGESGAGKSTLARFLLDAGWNVLCDERNVVAMDTRAELYSSPWYGTEGIYKRGSFPLSKIVILDPGHKGFSFQRLSLEEAVGEFLRTVFLPQFSIEGIRCSVNTIGELLLQVPVYKLSYAKDAVDIATELGALSHAYEPESLSRMNSRSL